jgi:hypothetical protein
MPSLVAAASLSSRRSEPRRGARKPEKSLGDGQVSRAPSRSEMKAERAACVGNGTCSLEPRGCGFTPYSTGSLRSPNSIIRVHVSLLAETTYNIGLALVTSGENISRFQKLVTLKLCKQLLVEKEKKGRAKVVSTLNQQTA